MSWFGVVIVTALITFCIVMSYRRGFVKGRREGAEMVLEEWRDFLDNMDQME